MPHIIINHSDNINFGDNWRSVLESCHDILTETLPTSITSCRSRLESHAQYHVGSVENQNQKGFVSVTIKAMAGRSAETLTMAGTAIFKLIQSHVTQQNPNIQVEFSVEMVDLAPVYIKAI